MEIIKENLIDIDKQEGEILPNGDEVAINEASEENHAKESQKLIMPCIPLRGISMFPYISLRFEVGREKSVRALNEAINGNKLIFLATQKDTDILIPTKEDYYTVGTVVKVNQMLKKEGDTIRLLVTGLYRAKVKETLSEDPIFKVEVEKFDYTDAGEETIELEALERTVSSMFMDYAEATNNIRPEAAEKIIVTKNMAHLANKVSEKIDLLTEEYQSLLESPSLEEHFKKIVEFLTKEIQIAKLKQDIYAGVQEGISQHQKEHYLREEMKVIQEELGQSEDVHAEGDKWLKELEELNLEEKITEKLKKEIKKFTYMHPSAADSAVARTYIETILALPWNNSTEINMDLAEAEKTLDEDHYGMDKVKERIIEYLAVVQLSKSIKGPILCLVGPPGVGKTSIAKSIARANGRGFTRMSLGGVRDEAEIRGHRRTYVGAIPGRIMTNIKEAKSNNLLFLLDEIDKLGSDVKGDPSSALLEVLDPEQNKDFTDHYLEVPFDLSKIMFITTANSTDTIPRPLLDRMEVIHLSGYTEEEKVKITQKYLVPKKINEHGLKDINIKITELAIRDIINYYTRESGVRNLERQVANICRKIAKSVVINKKEKFNITNKTLDKLLGKKTYKYDIIEGENEVGVTTGLAWTSVGGDTLFIETAKMPGTGKLSLTGNLGEVMQESAKTAVSYIRSVSKQHDIEENFYKEYDIHIHVPEGATPKDGPSAGITICTAIMSLLTGKKVKKEIAMTGEISLRGKVLPVGGIKEKVLAAHRANIKTIVLPLENKPNVDDIPVAVRKQLEFIFVEEVEEVFKIALQNEV